MVGAEALTGRGPCFGGPPVKLMAYPCCHFERKGMFQFGEIVTDVKRQ
jgi:hypothetical protein